MSSLETDKKMLKIINAMEIIEMSQPTIASKALSFALLHKDAGEASELFEALRARASISMEDTFSIDGYMYNLENLRTVATLSQQDAVSRDLTFLIDYFGQNTELLYRILKRVKRSYIHEGLRRNYMNN